MPRRKADYLTRIGYGTLELDDAGDLCDAQEVLVSRQHLPTSVAHVVIPGVHAGRQLVN